MSKEINSLRIYMREINDFPLLTRQEENILAKKIQDEGCEKSLNKLIESNLRLVVKIASDYNRYVLPIEDFVAQGNIGLIKAAKKFRPNLTCKFASYAQWWINQTIRLYISEHNNLVRIPLQSKAKIIKISNFTIKYRSEYKKEPTLNEIKDGTGFGDKTVRNLLPHIRHTEISLDSNNCGNDEDERSGYDYYLKDESLNKKNFIDELAHSEKMNEVLEFLNTLKPRSKEIIAMRFGIFCFNDKHTLEKISQKMGITKERVRQVEQSVLYQLRIFLQAERGWKNSGVS